MIDAQRAHAAAADAETELKGLRITLAELQSGGDRDAAVGRLMYEAVQLRLKEAAAARAADDARSAAGLADLDRARCVVVVLSCSGMLMCCE